MNQTNLTHETSAIPKEYFDNKPKRDQMNLEPYLNKHIAWNWDGSEVVAVADSYPELEARVRELGYVPSRVIYDFIMDG
jgi:hypothetical protein